jgi:hypothetical protein
LSIEASSRAETDISRFATRYMTEGDISARDESRGRFGVGVGVAGSIYKRRIVVHDG